MPHPQVWLYAHGKTAEAKGRRTCRQCHNTKEYCKTCHALPMPHPPNFISSTPDRPRSYGTPTCFNCHVLNELPGVPRAARLRRPTRSQPVQGTRVHPRPAAVADADLGGCVTLVQEGEERRPQEPRAPRRPGPQGVAARRPRRVSSSWSSWPACSYRSPTPMPTRVPRATSIKPEVTTYERTAHYRAGVACQQCHTKPGVFNYLIRNLQGATNIILYVSNSYERPLTTAVGTNNCVQCHPKSQIERDQVFNNIRVNHTGLREAGYQCITCHADISHPGTQLEVARVSQNKMPICARCHDGVQLPDDCSICHVGGAPPEEINVPIEGKVTPAQCKGCHQRQVRRGRLRRLPSRPRDAAPGALDQEPRRRRRRPRQEHLRRPATSRRTRSSASTATASRCRIRAAGRPATAATRSRTTTRRSASSATARTAASSATACRCRTRPAGCRSTPSVALSNPSLCNKCHSSSFCVGCHGVELPHSSAFIARPPEPRVLFGQHLHEVPRQRRHGPQGLLRRAVPRRFDQPALTDPAAGSVQHDR